MRNIVSRGKDVKEAVRVGLELLNVKVEDVHIEILQPETRGFLGLGTKKAVVKLSKNENNRKTLTGDPLETLEQAVDHMNINDFSSSHEPEDTKDVKLENKNDELLQGRVWIKNGILYCECSPTQYPTVEFGKDVQLFKNNKLVHKSPVIISDQDQYEIKPKMEESETKWNINMDSDKLRVTLYVKPGYQITRQLVDTEPTEHIKIVTKEDKKIINNIHYEEVINELQKLRVVHGFHHNEIMKALEIKEPRIFEIAAGIKPKPGKDGWLERMIETDTKLGLSEDEDGNIDFRESRTIPTVERGRVIAVIHPPVQGQPGVTVTNEPLPAKQTFPIEVKLGNGVMTVDDKIAASESGRPQIEQRGKLIRLSVVPRLIHRGDVDLASGNIHYIGDVEILGDIKDGMAVEAKGDIDVHSTINFSTVSTSGAILARGNVIGSELSSGKNNMLVAELGHMLGILYRQVEQLSSSIKQLVASPAFKQTDLSLNGLQPLIKILLEKKFKSFTGLSKQYVEVVKNGEDYLDQIEWGEISVSIQQIFLSLSNQIISHKIIDDLSMKMKKMHEWSQAPIEPDSYITLSSVLNSRLYSSGDVTIIGQGCVNTKIHAGGFLKVTGVVRGGELYGKSGIEINEAGAESGTSTFIAVPYDQKIKIHKAKEGTIIKIGNIKYVFKETTYDVYAYLNKDNQMLIH